MPKRRRLQSQTSLSPLPQFGTATVRKLYVRHRGLTKPSVRRSHLARAICVEQDFAASALRLFTCEKEREAWFETDLAGISWEDRNLCGVETRALLLGAGPVVALLLTVTSPQVISASARRLFTWGMKAQAWFKTSKKHKPWDTRNLKPLSAAVPEVVPGVACQGSRYCRVEVEGGG